jgi:cytosine permease
MEQKQKSALEDYGAQPVPDDKRKGWFGIGIVYWGIAVCLPAFLVSGLIAGPAKLGTAILAFVVGAAVLAVVAILTGIIGSRTKLSTALSANYTFGKYGAYILQIVLFFAAWGWFGVQLGFMAEGLGGGGLAFVAGGALPVWLIKVIGGILMTLTAMFGFKAIERLSIVAIPLLIISMLATIFSVYKGDTSLSQVASITAEGAMPFGVATSVIIGSFILGALISSDITRYAKSKSAAGVGMGFGMFIGFPVVMILAAIMVKGAGGEVDFSKVMLSNNSGFWVVLAIITIILAAWTTNDNNLYSGALSVNAMFPKVKKWIITVISGAIGLVLALVGINTSGGFQTFLGFLAIFIPPAAAVMIIDYYFFKGEKNKTYDSKELENVPKFRVIPFVVWFVGIGFGFLVQYTKVRITTITALDTIIVAAVIYFIVMLATKHKIQTKVAD